MKRVQTGRGIDGKQTRISFSEFQRSELEKEFNASFYVHRYKRTELAERLDLTERHVKIWLQNRRMRWKRDRREAQAAAGIASTLHQQPAFVDEFPTPPPAHAHHRMPALDAEDVNRLLQ